MAIPGQASRVDVAAREGAWPIAAAGLVALAVAMGIGRFAFTPILPMMQADAGVTIISAGWLAASNYLGYFVGALCAARLRAVWAIRGGLLLVAVVTFAMGLSESFSLWLVLRFAAGVASAWILVHVSAWGLERLSRLGRQDVSGVVFAGVGVGIAVAGLVCMVLMGVHASSAHAWEWFGGISLVLGLLVWRAFGVVAATITLPVGGATSKVTPGVAPRWTRDRVRLAVCYGIFGFGYIVPATFLPAMAHDYITDPVIFGWAWPVFGTAAAASTWAVSRWLHAANNRRVWSSSYVVMAIGVALPVFWPGLPAIIVSALFVGGTFATASMLGLWEAQRVAGVNATGLMAALTAAFAFMQVVGPLVVTAVAELPGGFSATLIAAAVVLLAGAAELWRSTIRSDRAANPPPL